MAASGKVELYVSFQGDYDYKGYQASVIDFEMRSCDEVFAAHVNTHLPASSKPRLLELEVSEKYTGNNVKMTPWIRLPVGVANTLNKISVRLFQTYTNRSSAVVRPNGRYEFEQRARRDDLPLKVPPLSFEGGGKYQIKVANTNEEFTVAIDRTGTMEVPPPVVKPTLTAQLIFERISASFIQTQGLRRFVPFQTLRHRTMDETIAWFGNEFPAKEIIAVVESYDPKTLVLTGDKTHDEEVIGLLNPIIEGMKLYPTLQSKAEFEEITQNVMGLYEAQKWAELFAIIDGNLPIADDDQPEAAQHGFYVAICNLAKRDGHHDLFVYTFNRMPEGRTKESHRQRYTGWLREEGMIMPRSRNFLGHSFTYEQFAEWIQQNSRAIVLGIRTSEEVIAEGNEHLMSLSLREKRDLRDSYHNNYKLISSPQRLKSEEYRQAALTVRNAVFKSLSQAIDIIDAPTPPVIQAEEKAPPPPKQEKQEPPTQPVKSGTKKEDPCVIA